MLALWLYTTAVFRSLNTPLRDTRTDRLPHSFPITMNYIIEGIGQLRSTAAEQSSASETLDLWLVSRTFTLARHFFSTENGACANVDVLD